MGVVLSCKGCPRTFERRPGPGRPREYCYVCRPATPVRAAPLPPIRLAPVAAGIVERLHPDDPVALEVRELRERAADLGVEAEQLVALADAKRREAATLVARAERLTDPSKGVRVPKTPTPLERVRDDGLMTAAGLAAEDLHDGFTPADLAYLLDITDLARAGRLLAALEQLGKVRRHGDGWAHEDSDERRARDFVINAREFTADDMAMIVDMPASDVAYYLDRFKARGLISNGGSVYRYVDPDDDAPHTRPRRRPPELDPPAGSDAPKRGEPIRIVDHGKAAQPGQRHKMKQRQRAWDRLNGAVEGTTDEQRKAAQRSGGKSRRMRK